MAEPITMNKVTWVLATLVGLFSFLSVNFPVIQKQVAVIIAIVPMPDWLKTVILIIAVIVAVIVWAYDYITSKNYAQSEREAGYQEGLYTPVPETDAITPGVDTGATPREQDESVEESEDDSDDKAA